MHILVTGAGRGLGFEFCKVFLEEGHIVFPVVRSESSLNMLKQHFPRNCYPTIADLSEDNSIQLIQDSLLKHTNHLDIIINNAGSPSQIPDFQFDNVKTENMAKLFNIHCLGVVRTLLATKSLLVRSENPIILDISSRLGSLTWNLNKKFESEKLSFAYRIAKASQNMLTICLHNELSILGVKIFAVHPGKFKSSTSHGNGEWSANEAAINIINWLKAVDEVESGKFIHPNFEHIPW